MLRLFTYGGRGSGTDKSSSSSISLNGFDEYGEEVASDSDLVLESVWTLDRLSIVYILQNEILPPLYTGSSIYKSHFAILNDSFFVLEDEFWLFQLERAKVHGAFAASQQCWPLESIADT